MDNSTVRAQVSDLLTQIATLVGVNSPAERTRNFQGTGVVSAAPTATNQTSSETIPFGINSPPRSSTSATGTQNTPTGFSSPNFTNQVSAPGLRNENVNSVLSELRNRFAAYGQPSRTRAAERSANRRRTVVHERTWCNRFFCLASPTDNKTLQPYDRQILGTHGLGETIVVTEANASSATLIGAIQVAFPKLQDISFELLRALSGGNGKPLVRISATMSVPPIVYLKAARASIIYIRPLLAISISEQNVCESEVHEAQEREPLERNDQQVIITTSVETTASCSSMSNSQVVETDEVMTLEDFRQQGYLENPGEQFIVLSRDNFIERIYGVYKNPHFNFLKKPKVEFRGEAGADLGAISKEYFWKGLLALSREKFNGKYLFEGEPDHQLPTLDSKLLRSGVYKYVGYFISHCIIHCGVGFIGLSEAAAEFLTMDEIDSDTPFTITVEDVPYVDVRETIYLVLTNFGVQQGLPVTNFIEYMANLQIRRMQCGETLTDTERHNVQTAAISSDFNEIVDKTNASFAVEHLLYYHVIEKRRPYLDAIKFAMKKTGLFQFVVEKPYLHSAMFPRLAWTNYPAAAVIDRIKYTGSTSMKAFVDQYIQRISSEPQKIQKLLRAWTGWPIIPDSDLEILVDNDIDFKANTCFNQIQIPSNFTQLEVTQMFDMLVDLGEEGFGSI